MRMVPVALGARSYEVRIESGLLDRAAEQLAPFARKRPFVIVTDANVAPHGAGALPSRWRPMFRPSFTAASARR